MSFGYSADFRRVGREVEFGDTRVSYGDVQPIRDVAQQHFYNAATTQDAAFSEHSSAASGALFFRGMTEIDLDAPNLTMSMKLTHESLPDGWRLTAGVGTFKDFDGPQKKQMWYRVETMGNEVLVATKAVKFIMDQVDIIVEDDEPESLVTSNRKMYEKPMEPADCIRLTEQLQRAAARAGSRIPDPLAANPLRRVG